MARAKDSAESRAFMVYVADLMGGFYNTPAAYRFSTIIEYGPPQEEIDVEATIDYVARMAEVD